MRHRVRGYSLYEILMTLTVVAVIVGLGLPSYSGVVARNRQHVEINALFHAIHVARKESIMRRRVVTICPSFDGQACNIDRSNPAQVPQFWLDNSGFVHAVEPMI